MPVSESSSQERIMSDYALLWIDIFANRLTFSYFLLVVRNIKWKEKSSRKTLQIVLPSSCHNSAMISNV
jgi:hypothetical protein